ncbi:MAG: DUF3843 family protein [Cytophagales bacterium]|nr:DUF3843 family protein [Cytophagales bacterium]
MKKAGRIYINQWHSFKSPDAHSSTDTYYLNLCNEIKQGIYRTEAWETLEEILDKEGVDQLCVYLAAYLEDLVSETNIWNSFVRVHQRLYDTPLPYYEIKEYYAGEVNYEDICFLIWYFLNCLQEHEFVSHLNVFILQLGEAITDMLIPAWEEAPENQRLKASYELSECETDYYVARSYMEHVFFDSYLFYPDTGIRLKETLEAIAEEHAEDDNLSGFLDDSRDHLLYNTRTQLLALKSHEWVAEILGDTHPLHEAFQSLTPKINSVFLYKGERGTHFSIEHIASGRAFDVRLEDFISVDEFEVDRTMMMLGIVNWREEWWFSGVCSPAPYDEKIVEEQRGSLSNKQQVHFLQDPQKTGEVLSFQRKCFLEFNEGQPIAFMWLKDVEVFINDFWEHYEKHLPADLRAVSNVSKEKSIGEQMIRQLFEDNRGLEASKEVVNALVFFNPIAGLEIVPGFNDFFPFDHNQFYNAEDANDYVDRIFFAENVSKELAEFFVEHAGDKLDFFKEDMGVSYLHHLDFLLRFWKMDDYQTSPSFSLVCDPANQ